MPAYVAGTATALYPGDSLLLFNAETVAANSESIAFARASSPGGDDAGSTFEIDFAASPTAVVTIQGANTDLDANYQTLYTSTNAQHDNYTDNARWEFYRCKVSTYSAGGALTVKVQR